MPGGVVDIVVVAGAGVEDGESFEQAAKRELLEELGLTITDLEAFCTVETDQAVEKYFISHWDAGAVDLICWEEHEKNIDDNLYAPVWVDMARVARLNLVPTAVKARLVEKYENDSGC